MPVDAVALVKEAVERAEDNVIWAACIHGVKSERFVRGSYGLNPFFEGVAIAGQLGDGDRRETAMQKFVLRI